MSFERILQTIVDECGGGFGAALMGLDGIAIAQTTSTGPLDPEDPFVGDVTGAGIEFGRILAETSKASDALGAGDLRETIIRLDRVTLIFRAIESDVFLVLAISPDGNLGKARYLVRRSSVEIQEQL